MLPLLAALLSQSAPAGVLPVGAIVGRSESSRVDRTFGAGGEPFQAVHLGEFASVAGNPKVAGPGAPKSGVAIEHTPIYAGMRVSTGLGERVVIRFNDGTRISLRNAIVEFPALTTRHYAYESAPRPRRMRLDFGSIEADVKESPIGEVFEVVTPTATATVLGTRFTLVVREIDPTTEPQGRGGQGRKPAEPAKLESILRVLGGEVRFSNRHGEQIVDRLNEAIARWDQPPARPVRLGSLKIVVASLDENRFTLSERPALPGAAWRLAYPVGWTGMHVEDVETEEGGFETRVTRVVRGSPADRAGVKVGDRVASFEGAVEPGASAISAAVKSGRNELVSVSLRRVGQPVDVRLRTIPDPDAFGAADTIPVSPDVLAASRLLIERRAAEGASLLGQALARRPNDAAAHNNLGLHFETEDRLWLAIDRYRKAVDLQPNVALYRLNLGMALLNSGDFYHAITEFRRARELAPDWPEPAYKLGRAYMLGGRHDEDVDLSRAVVRSFPDSPDAWNELGIALHEAGRHREALEAVQRALDLEPEFARAQFLRGTICKDLGRKEDALAALERAGELDPTDAATFADLGGCYDDLQRETEAEAAYRRAIELDPERSLTYSNYGYHHMLFGRYDEAERLYRKAIELDPTSTVPYTNLGALFIENPERQHEAEALFVEAVGADQNNSVAWSNLGLLANRRGDAETAESLYLRAIDTSPGFVAPYVNLAILLIDQKKMSEAESLLLKARELAPDLPLVYQELGWIYQHTSRIEDAEAMYRKRISLDPSNYHFHDNLAAMYADLGRWRDAANTFAEMLEFDADSALYNVSVAWALDNGHFHEESEPYYRRALKADPDHVTALRGLAMTLVVLEGDLDEALALARRALELEEPKLEQNARYARAFARYPEALGRVHTARGEFEEAERALRRALDLSGEGQGAADTWFHLGAMFETKGERGGAVEAYRSALKILPDHKEAVEALRRIGGGADDIDGTRRQATERALEGQEP